MSKYLSVSQMLDKRPAKFFESQPWYNKELLNWAGTKWQPYSAELLIAMFHRPLGADRVARDLRMEMGAGEPPERAHDRALKWLLQKLSERKFVSRIETTVKPEQLDALKDAVKTCFPKDTWLHNKVDKYL